ncbi:hypothetical protein F5Y10DRAFT_186653 [Nemania abortiva]|nr:hypothetical protein F5Y10DRAFT_186653 [Nemania abortiva]
MEVETATEMAAPASNPPEGSPVMAARDVSRTPGRETNQPQPADKPAEKPAETVPNGVKASNGDDSRSTASPLTATPGPELVRPASRTPPQPAAQPPSSLPPSTAHSPPSAQPPSTQPPPTQPPPTQPPSTQPSPAQPLPTRLPLTQLPPPKQPSPIQLVQQLPLAHLPPAHTQPVPSALHGRLGSLQASQSPHQNYLGPPSMAVPRGSAPPPSQVGQPHRQPREMSRAPKRFPSPEFDHDARIPKFDRDLSLLADEVQRACPEAVRRIVRDKWEKCIMGSEFHHAFLMNAIIHHASGTIMRRAVRDFGQNMVSEAKHEIAAHLRPNDIDEIASVILEKCSDQFLDRALEKRLTTIDARSLINALARAERLGYENSDILEDRPEKLAPMAQMHSPGFGRANLIAGTQPQPLPPAHTRPPPASQPQPAPQADLKCRLCWRSFQDTKTYEYHVQKQLCIKAGPDAPKFSCGACGAGFTTKVGQAYHISNAVCGPHAFAPATPASQVTAPKPEVPPPNHAHHPIPLTQLPPGASQPYSTPVRPTASPIGTPSSSTDDPYRHLTPQQRAELDEDLRQAELSYGPRFKEAEEIADPIARKSKLESLQNTFSTKQSIIRKKYGVRLRVRRTRAEIDGERSRMGIKHGLSSPGPASETPSAKRQRSDDAMGQPSYIGRDPPVEPPVASPANHLSVSEMNNSGLGGSTATAAITDPTTSLTPIKMPPAEDQPPSNSLSSLQRKGYRVSSHVGQATQPAPTPFPSSASAPVSPLQRNGSASAPVVLDDSSDGSDTDEDIPATVPPRKAS